MVFAASSSTCIVNIDNALSGLTIDYTICSDKLENNATCSDHKKQYIWYLNPLVIPLKNDKEIVYVWKASSSHGEAGSDYSEEKSTAKGTMLISSCFSNKNNFITLDSYGTNRMGCNAVPG